MGRPFEFTRSIDSREPPSSVVFGFDELYDTTTSSDSLIDDALQPSNPVTSGKATVRQGYETSLQYEHDDANLTFEADHILLDHSQSHEKSSNGTRRSNSVPTPQKEDCLHRLSELNSFLFRQLSSLSSTHLVDWLSQLEQHRPETPISIGKPLTEPSPCTTSPIGTMLQVSREFLEILACFKQPFAAAEGSPPFLSSASSTSFPSHLSLESSSSGLVMDNLFTNDLNLDDLSTVPSLMHSCPSSSSNQTPTSGLSSAASPLISGGGGGAGSDLTDIASTLAILTCYVCLVRVYRTIFSTIRSLIIANPTAPTNPQPNHNSLAHSQHHHNTSSTSSSTSISSFPNSTTNTNTNTNVLPNLHLAGFSLDNQPHLQIRVLLEVSTHMLEEVEDALGMPDDGSGNGKGAGRGLLEDSLAASILGMVVTREMGEGERPEVGAGTGVGVGVDRTGAKALRAEMEEIKALLRGRGGR
ncbi:hypothetical protein MMC21_007988 [Puttea exsequens]|nr:hypothetical protein [Puttea exsequens]